MSVKFKFVKLLTQLKKIVCNAKTPLDRPLSRLLRSFWSSLVAILDLATGEALNAVRHSVAGGEQVPPLPLRWYFNSYHTLDQRWYNRGRKEASNLFLKIQNIKQ